MRHNFCLFTTKIIKQANDNNNKENLKHCWDGAHAHERLFRKVVSRHIWKKTPTKMGLHPNNNYTVQY